MLSSTLNSLGQVYKEIRIFAARCTFIRSPVKSLNRGSLIFRCNYCHLPFYP